MRLASRRWRSSRDTCAWTHSGPMLARMRHLRRLAAIGAAVMTVAFTPRHSGAQSPQSPETAMPATATCATDSAFHVLDFWIGNWTVVDSAGKELGTNRIERILGGCAITESWHESESEGRSLFYYVPSQRMWKQVWVTPQALELGGVKEKHLIAHALGSARFQGELIGPRGALVLDRTTLTRLSDGRVRQVIEISRDGGATWQLNFDGFYVAVKAR
jgi:hypothetical protein